MSPTKAAPPPHKTRRQSPGPRTLAEGRRIRSLFLGCAWIEPPASVLDLITDTLADADVWAGAAAVAQRVNQEPLFLHFVRHYASEAPLPAPTRLELESQSLYHAFRWEGTREAVEGLLQTMASRGLTPVLLKGISQAGESYSPPHLRPMRDIDLLVEEDRMADALKAAEDAGFAPDPARHPGDDYVGHHHAPPMFQQSTGVCLELHHALVRQTDRFQGFPGAAIFREATRPSRVFQGLALVLEPTHEILNTCAHITHGDSIGRRVTNLIDLARIVETDGESIDWTKLESYAGAPDVARSLLVPLGYLAREGLASPPIEVLRQLRQLSGLQDWELELLWALIDRYRIGSPTSWPLVSGRIANILWREALRRASTPRRSLRTAYEIVRGRWK